MILKDIAIFLGALIAVYICSEVIGLVIKFLIGVTVVGGIVLVCLKGFRHLNPLYFVALAIFIGLNFLVKFIKNMIIKALLAAVAIYSLYRAFRST